MGDTAPVKRQRKKAKAELLQNQRIRTRFELQDSEHHEPGTDSVLFYSTVVQEHSVLMKKRTCYPFTVTADSLTDDKKSEARSYRFPSDCY